MNESFRIKPAASLPRYILLNDIITIYNFFLFDLVSKIAMGDEVEIDELDKRIKAKEDLVRKLKMVKLHRTKVSLHFSI